MIAVIFEVWPAEGERQHYLDLAAALRADLERMDGFISVERFQSLTEPGQAPLALLLARRGGGARLAQPPAPPRHPGRRAAAACSRDYRLRIAGVLRDYGMTERAEAPDDSRAAHRA